MGRGVFQYAFGFLPRRHPITVVVGRPISVDKVENPSEAQVNQLHKQYLEALQSLYKEYNPIYGDPKVDLHFIWERNARYFTHLVVLEHNASQRVP